MRAGLLVALYFAFMALLVVLSRSSAMAWLQADSDGDYPVNYARWGAVLIELVLYGMPAIIFANVFPLERFRWFRFGVPVSAKALLAAALGMIAFTFFADWAYTAILSMVSDPQLKEIQESLRKSSEWFQDMQNPGDLALMLFASALVPAVFEELFFRASLQQLLADWMKFSPQFAIWISALFFAFVHNNPVGFPVIFLAGVVLGYAFYWTGSLRINILMHFLFNATSLVESYFAQHSLVVAAWRPSGLFVAGCTAVAFVGFGLVLRFSKR
jgi:hypothetical protein